MNVTTPSETASSAVQEPTTTRVSEVLTRRARRASHSLALTCSAGGLLGLAGWLWDVQTIKSLLPGLVTMKANTAFAFAITGVGLFNLRASASTWARYWGIASAIGLLLLGAVTLGQMVFGFDAGIDELLFRDKIDAVQTGSPGRMAPLTAAVFALSGIGLLALHAGRPALEQGIAILVLLVALLGLTGYAYGVTTLYQLGSFTAMALPTAMLFLLLSVSLLLAEPGHGLANLLTSSTPAGHELRQLLLAMFFLPFALGAMLRIADVAGWIEPAFALALFAMGMVVSLTTIVVFFGRHLNVAEATRAQALRRLAASEQRFRGTFDHAAVGIAHVGIGGRWMRFNSTVCDILGYSAEELQELTLQDIVSRQDLNTEQIQQLIQGDVDHNRAETRHVHQSGAVVWVDWRVVVERDVDGSAQHLIVTLLDITARKELENRLREFAAVVENTADFVGIYDLELKPTYVNPAGLAMVGLESLAAARETPVMDFFWPADRKRIEAEAIPTLQRADRWNGEVRFRHFETKGPIHTLWNATIIRDTLGQPVAYATVSPNLNEVKAAEHQIHETQQRLQQALDVGRLGEWVLYLCTNRVQRSALYDHIFGYDEPLPDWTYQRFMDHVYADDRDRVDAAFQKTLSEGVNFDVETRILRADGALRWIWVRGSVVATDQGMSTQISGVVQDITQRRRHADANQFLANIAAPLNTLVEYESTLQSVAQLAVQYLADWCVIDLADDAGRLTRVANAHSIAEHGSLVHQLRLSYAQSETSTLGQVLQTRKSRCINSLSDTDLQGLAQDSKQLNVLYELQPAAFIGVPLVVRDRCLGVMALFTSASGRRFTKSDVALAERVGERITIALENAKLYESLRKADERKDVFLAMLAHELRNPLGALSNGLEVLRPQLTGEDSKWTLEMMDRQRHQVTRLLDDLMDISRINLGKVTLNKRPMLLEAALENAVATIKPALEGKQQTLVTQFSARPVSLNADPVRLEQIVMNLLTNAVKYTPARGSIRLSTMRDNDALVIKVADTGVGIAEDELQHVFELFKQIGTDGPSTTSGLGLGLSLVRELVTLHGGSVWATSAGDGQGSTFTVSLPIAEDTATVSADVRTANSVARENLDIVVCDDNRDSARALGRLLEQQGHRVRLAFDGKTALQMVKEQCTDLMLLEVDLPDISSCDVADRVRGNSANASLHLVTLSGHGQPHDYEKSEPVGFEDHLATPLNLEAFNKIIQRLKI